MLIAPPLLHGIIASLQQLSLPARELLGNTGYAERDLGAAKRTKAALAMTALWQAAERASGNPFIAYEVGKRIYVEQLGILGFILRNCETVGKALSRMETFNRLTNDFIDFESNVANGVLEIGFNLSVTEPLEESLQRRFILLELGFLGVGLSQLLHVSVVPAYVYCQLPRSDRAFLEEQLGCPVHHDQRRNGMGFAASLINAPILLPDSMLRAQLEKVAKAELDRFALRSSWADKVRCELIERLDGEKPTVQQVAEALSISARVLQRRLKDESTSFQTVLDETRRDLAQHYLQEPYSVNEVAYLVGFELPSAFSRAFKSWTGQSPQAFKRSRAPELTV